MADDAAANHDLAASIRYCRELSRRRGRNFYYAFPLLPREKKDALCAIYAFMRHSDDLADRTAEAEAIPRGPDAATGAADRSEVRKTSAGRSAASDADGGTGGGRGQSEAGVVRAEGYGRIGTAGGAPGMETAPAASVAADAASAAEALRRWREDLHAALDGRTGSCPVWPALRHAVERFSIPRRYFDELLDGVEMDLSISRYETFDDLYRYCYRVASVVGLVCLHVFGFADGRALECGEACGIAFQLTNILRDIREDSGLGRVYLPMEDLRRFGISERNLIAGDPEDRVAELIRFEAARAKEYYVRALPLFELVGRDSRAGLRTMMEIYWGILSRIATDPLIVYRTRAGLSSARKLAIALRAFLRPGPPEIPG
ncbi:MAG: phytoene/squalene synthase family protein [Planctomycetota bacterium]|nr:phytoene/squalene synthase family protein [Planctomycetota bacterium]